MRSLVVVPTYLEAENIERLLRGVRAAAPVADVLVVDDNSSDNTAALAEQVGRDLGQIDVLRRDEKEGLGPAYRAGFSLGIERGYDVLVEMDADLSHDPAALPTLLAAAGEGVDLVIGSRYVVGGAVENWPWYRRAISRWGNRYAAFVLGLPTADATSGYRAYRATTLLDCDYAGTRANGYAFQIELAYRVHQHGGAIREVPIVFNDRVLGRSKMSPRIAFEAMAVVTQWAIRDRLLRRSNRRRAARIST